MGRTRWLDKAFSLLLVFAACNGLFASGAPDGASEGVPATATEVPSSSAIDELDKAIREASDYLNSNIPMGSKVAILNIRSDSSALSSYIIDELIAHAVNDKVFTVVDRQQLNTIRAEQNFQLTGDVDDNSAQEIGKLLGAQTIVSGAVNKYGDLYRMSIRALEVQTAQVQGQFNKNIPASGATITALANSQSSVYDVPSYPQSTGGGGETTTAVTVATAAPGPEAPTPAASPVHTETPVIPAAPETPKVYKVGDTGPGGGIVFYDKGNKDGGWQYMEVTTSSLGNVATGPNAAVRTGTAIGAGKKNTLLIMDYVTTNGKTADAVQLCANYTGGGYDDWFLPSKDELNAVYTSLVASDFVFDNGMSGWQKEYWTSSGSGSWYNAQRFNDGDSSSYYTNTELDVRAVRQF